MMVDPIEALARAICKNASLTNPRTDDEVDRDWMNYTKDARAAADAYRDALLAKYCVADLPTKDIPLGILAALATEAIKERKALKAELAALKSKIALNLNDEVRLLARIDQVWSILHDHGVWGDGKMRVVDGVREALEAKDVKILALERQILQSPESGV
jgi:hypothetical protein